MSEKFDVVVVGVGPAGNAAAYTLAKSGLNVLQLERGEYPGSKNVQGAILYANSLERIIPNFRETAPLERHIIEQRLWMMDEKSFIGTHYRSDEFNSEPYNRYTIIRARFDKWFSEKVQAADALVICEMTVKALLRNDSGRVIGVEVEREDGKIYADAVILADGVNSLVATNAGLRKDIQAGNVALAVKEMICAVHAPALRALNTFCADSPYPGHRHPVILRVDADCAARLSSLTGDTRLL